MNENEMIIEGLDDIEVANTSIDDIESENVNLIFVGIDQSGSMHPYVTDMGSALSRFKQALEESKESDDILVARANFAADIDIGGYKKISEFDCNYTAWGATPMYDVIVDGSLKLDGYRTFLKDQGVRVKAVFAIFSDGDDTCSVRTFGDAKAAIEKLNHEEITTAFISFGGAATKTAKDLGFRNILDVASSASELRKAFDCLSKSVIESSKSVVADEDDFFQI